MLLVFNVFDFIGRNSPALFIAKGMLLCGMIVGRFVFWVTFLLVASDQPPTWLFGGDATWFKFINMACFAFTNGFTCTCCMILGPAQVRPAWKDRAGSIMSTALVWGIFAGALFSNIFSLVATPPSD